MNDVDYIKSTCEKWNIIEYVINDDLTIDVFTDVALDNYKRNPELCLYEIPLNFRYVYGDFDCSYQKITSLKGSPIACRSFSCVENRLTSLEHSPQYVKYNYWCDDNRDLTSLNGITSGISSKHLSLPHQRFKFNNHKALTYEDYVKHQRVVKLESLGISK